MALTDDMINEFNVILRETTSTKFLPNLMHQMVTAPLFQANYFETANAGIYKILTMGDKITPRDYDRLNGIAPTTHGFSEITFSLKYDKAINELIDNLVNYTQKAGGQYVANMVQMASRGMAEDYDNDAQLELLTSGTTLPYTTPLTKTNVREILVGIKKECRIKNLNTRNLVALISPQTEECIINSGAYMRNANLGNTSITDNTDVASFGGFDCITSTTLPDDVDCIIVDPAFCVRVIATNQPLALHDGNGTKEFIGAYFLKARFTYFQAVLKSEAVLIKKNA